MNDRRTTLGGGTIRTTEDSQHVAHVAAVREHLGIGEDVRVENLSPLEFLALQAKQCRGNAENALEDLKRAAAEYSARQKDADDAQRFYENGQRLEDTTAKIMEENK